MTSTQRTRLPATRQSITHAFRVQGDATDPIIKGYLTVGLFPDGQPSELFIRIDSAHHYALSVIQADLEALDKATIKMPWNANHEKTLRLLVEILAGRAKPPTIMGTCHACGCSIEIQNALPPGARKGFALCQPCISLFGEARLALEQAPEAKRKKVLAAFGCETIPQLAELTKDAFLDVPARLAKPDEPEPAPKPTQETKPEPHPDEPEALGI